MLRVYSVCFLHAIYDFRINQSNRTRTYFTVTYVSDWSGSIGNTIRWHFAATTADRNTHESEMKTCARAFLRFSRMRDGRWGENKKSRINKKKKIPEKRAEKKTVVYAGARLHFFPVYSDHAQQPYGSEKLPRRKYYICFPCVCVMYFFPKYFFFCSFSAGTATLFFTTGANKILVVVVGGGERKVPVAAAHAHESSGRRRRVGEEIKDGRRRRRPGRARAPPRRHPPPPPPSFI